MTNFNSFTDGPKKISTKSYPLKASNTSSLFRRTEPFLTPKLLKKRYLKGIEGLDYSTDELKDEINLAANEVELELKLAIYPTTYQERKPFDRALYREFVFTKLNNAPLLQVEDFSIVSSNGEFIYRIPASWVEVDVGSNQLNIVPILNVFGAAGLRDGQASNAGLIFLRAISNFNWLPAFFTIEYTTGLCSKEGQLPVVVNDVIGLTTAIEILSNMQNRNINSSQSISQDGISQSSSSAGTQIFQSRIDELKERRQKKINRIQAIFSRKYFMSNM